MINHASLYKSSLANKQPYAAQFQMMCECTHLPCRVLRAICDCQGQQTHIHLCAHIHTCTHSCVPMSAHLPECVHLYKHTNIHMNTHVHT